MQTPSEILAQLREKQGLSLREAALRSRGLVSHSYIADLEKGIQPWSKISLTTLEGLARAYGLTVERLLELMKQPETEGGGNGARPEARPDEPALALAKHDDLTRRERLAGLALQGLNANPATGQLPSHEKAKRAVQDADELIRALDEAGL